MRTTLTVTLLGLITLLAVTNAIQHRELAHSLCSSSVHLKECIDMTTTTRTYMTTHLRCSAAIEIARVLAVLRSLFSVCLFDQGDFRS